METFDTKDPSQTSWKPRFQAQAPVGPCEGRWLDSLEGESSSLKPMPSNKYEKTMDFYNFFSLGYHPSNRLGVVRSLGNVKTYLNQLGNQVG